MPHRLRQHFTLFRPPKDSTSDPTTLHSYLILAGPLQAIGSGVATIMGLNTDTPLPSRAHVVVQEGGPEAALREARSLIIHLAANSGLSSWPKILDTFEEW